ncbi:hypothetical protein [Actinomadura bangladeshensis]|uniref:hypothetical protein n=1 Tax=Actinomadura bangladeshensis TaxID=453573 RepID=UPI001EF20832|nr:hypothetical protein [Actinomadura bangladeshensis]
MRLDLAALNKVETLRWDIWGAGAGSDDDLTDDIRDLYHRVALLTSDKVRFEAVRTAFTEDENLRTPRTVLSLAPFNGPRQVTLR